MRKLFTLALSLLTLTSVARAQLLNIQSARDATYTMTGKAVLGNSASDVWAMAPNDDVYVGSAKQTYGELASPTYANGNAATGVSVLFHDMDALYSGNFKPWQDASNLFGSYIRINPPKHKEMGGSEPNASIEITGLKHGATYTLVVYGNDEASNGNGRSFEITVNGQSKYLNLVQTAGYKSEPDGETQGVKTWDGNYLKFTGLSTSDGSLTINILGLTGGGEVDIAGLQLEPDSDSDSPSL